MSKKKEIKPLKMVPRDPDPVYTVEQALTELLAEIKSGKTKPVKAVLYYVEEGSGPGNWIPTTWHCGTDRFEALALLDICRDRIMGLVRGTEEDSSDENSG